MAVALEQRALDMVLDLLDIPAEWFKGRSVTTGATASNIMGLGMPSLLSFLTRTDFRMISSVWTRRPSPTITTPARWVHYR